MEVGGMLPFYRQEEISPIKEGDYVGEDGLIRCGVCGKRKKKPQSYLSTKPIPLRSGSTRAIVVLTLLF